MPRRGRPVARDAARVRPRRDASVPASTPATPGDGPAVPVEIRLRAPAPAATGFTAAAGMQTSSTGVLTEESLDSYGLNASYTGESYGVSLTYGITESSTSEEDAAEVAEDVVAKEDSGWNLGAALSVGLLSGESFTNVPTGGTVVLTTPYGFNLGPLRYTISLGFGGYSGSYDGDTGGVDKFNPSFVGLGGNLVLANLIFAEGHVGNVGAGTGFRGFAGITLEKLNLPFNLLIGSEAFYSTEISSGGNASGWASIGVRLDYNF